MIVINTMPPQPIWELYSPHLGIGHQILYYPELSSTQDVAWEMVKSGPSHGNAIMAGAQTKGRGRSGRQWIDGAQEASLLISMILVPTPYLATHISMLTAIAVLRCIKRLTGLEAEIKWPNDLLFNGRKLSGILVETEMDTAGTIDCVVGVGLNLDFDDMAYPPISGTTASINKISASTVAPLEAACILLEELDHAYSKAQSSNVDLHEWASRVATLGELMTIRDRNQLITGNVERIDTDGCLSLRLPNGSLKSFFTGEVLI
jgi:BirA family biotin operon repressor/biotin-[acetyl-CoA-carboxylase] ligase